MLKRKMAASRGAPEWCGRSDVGRHTMHKPGFCLKYENATKREEFWAELFLEGATYYNAWI